ncbi:hypothetical protein K438DRAFT_1768135 [Mycena galopus ATCC 62051]|nr:hypothetical protein K438DRAFT_1768135 [Mycena galopus ATCC 62051]
MTHLLPYGPVVGLTVQGPPDTKNVQKNQISSSHSSNGHQGYLHNFQVDFQVPVLGHKLKKFVAEYFLIPQELEFNLLASPHLSIAKMLDFPLPLPSSAMTGSQPAQFFSKELPDISDRDLQIRSIDFLCVILAAVFSHSITQKVQLSPINGTQPCYGVRLMVNASKVRLMH